MSFLGGLPSENKSNFSVVAARKPGASNKIKPSSKAPALYTATHDTAPPSNQVIATEKTDLLFRKLMQKQEGLSGGHKREADDKVEVQERRAKQIKTSRGSEKGKERLDKEEEENAAEDEEEEEEKTQAAVVTAQDDEAEQEEEEAEVTTQGKKNRRKKPARSTTPKKKRKTED
ncbi:uncharacterized protein ACA1_236120 [Acanthamoeba castellanii str. Neff]|uniref:DET1- and DDB1-associated protein 1 domain-containing protein n=1 Tax=Acanthamoeba castellanii (strain ATCC 30010 / Neff) TaxID=1257118 RepID=L8H0P0_ACACF|nr:uncharacterized protein ACA1_236120 [Acanthamoeba castellanii str. Neff]ELR19054.1 hypothetical protein ACA1_236120 [Acanthamoeba castellanii str. Neff]